MMRRIARKFVLIGILTVLVLSMTGCGASVSWYISSTSTGSRHTLEVRVPETLRSELEKTAAPKFDTPLTWTLDEYLTLFSGLVTFGDGSKYEYVRMYTEGTDAVYVLVRDFTPSDDTDDGDDDVDMTVKDYFFFYTVEVTQPNPFNGLRSDYDDAAPGQNVTLMQMLKNGIGTTVDNKWVTVLPPLDEAFPRVGNYDADEFKLNLYLGGSNRMASDGSKVRMRNGTYYLWERKFDTEDTTITLQYYRPNSLGWNIVAIVAAGLTVTVILLATRGNKKKHKPTLEERFPYDPSKPDDGNLPSDGGGFRY